MKSLYIALFSLFIASNASAQNLDSKHGDWEVYTGNGVCYMASTPVKEDGNWSKRGQPYALVNFKKGQTDEVNVTSGYPYKPNVDLDVSVDSRKFKLFVDGEHGWAKDSGTDKLLVDAIKNGSNLVVKATSKLGTYSVDTYSLKGTGAAYKRMVELCK
jgi:hypothetical protein